MIAKFAALENYWRWSIWCWSAPSSSRLARIDMLIASLPTRWSSTPPPPGVNSAPGLYNAHQAGSPFTRVGAPRAAPRQHSVNRYAKRWRRRQGGLSLSQHSSPLLLHHHHHQHHHHHRQHHRFKLKALSNTSPMQMKTSSPNAIPIPKVNFCCQGIRPIFFTFAPDLEAIISKKNCTLTTLSSCFIEQFWLKITEL